MNYDFSGEHMGSSEPGPHGDSARARALAGLADLLNGRPWSAPDADATPQEIAAHAAALTGASAASLFLYDEAGDFTRGAYAGLSTHAAHELDKLGRTDWVRQYLAANKRPLVLDIAPGDRHPSPIQKLAAAEGMAELVAVPLTFGSNLLGLLILYHAESRPYTATDFDFLRVFSTFVALYLANSSLEHTRAWERRAQDGFLEALGHELRTPLTSILGFTQIVRKRLSASGNGEVRLRDHLDLIWAQAQRMNRLLDTFVDVSNMERGEFIIEHGTLDLIDTLRRSVSQAIAQNRSGHPITFTVPESPLTIPGDLHRLEHVFAHLISNALKYSPDTEPVSVICEEYPARREAVVLIADHGHGISRDLHKEIFKRFFPSGTRKAGGMGMGLYASRAIVEAHGGRLTLMSAPGEGTTVTIVLPTD